MHTWPFNPKRERTFQEAAWKDARGLAHQLAEAMLAWGQQRPAREDTAFAWRGPWCQTDRKANMLAAPPPYLWGEGRPPTSPRRRTRYYTKQAIRTGVNLVLAVLVVQQLC